MFWGFVLVMMGLLMLAERMGLIYGDFWDYFWPVILVAIGGSMILDSKKKNQNQ